MATTFSPLADWLDVTTPPESGAAQRVLDLLSPELQDMRGEASRMTVKLGEGQGVLMLETNKAFERISASGGALAALRLSGLFQEYLMAISESPHRVTRLDVALDFAIDFPKTLHSIRSRHPSGQVSMTRKTLRLSEFLSKRESDGAYTGTVYAGHRSRAKVTARIYDKQAEALDNRCEVIPPTTRYELTVRSGVGATLGDAYSPASIFWHHMVPTFLKSAPDSVKPWEPDSSYCWSSQREQLEPAQKLKRFVEDSVWLDQAIRLADDMGPNGRVYLARQLATALGCRVDFGGSDGRVLPAATESHTKTPTFQTEEIAYDA